MSRDIVVENNNDYVYIENKIQHFDVMGAEKYEGFSDTISIPHLDEYLGIENGVELFKITILEGDSAFAQKINKEFNKAVSKMNLTEVIKSSCGSVSGEIESFLINGLKESHVFPYDIKEKYGSDIKNFSQFPYYLAGIKEVNNRQTVRDKVSFGIAGTFTYPLCDVLGRTAGAKISANFTAVSCNSKAYAYKFKHKQKPGIVGGNQSSEIGPFLSIENYQWLGGEVNVSARVNMTHEMSRRIDIVGDVSISYKLTF